MCMTRSGLTSFVFLTFVSLSTMSFTNMRPVPAAGIVERELEREFEGRL